MRVRRLEIRAFGGPEVIQLVEDPALPEPSEGEVRIKVEAAARRGMIHPLAQHHCGALGCGPTNSGRRTGSVALVFRAT